MCFFKLQTNIINITSKITSRNKLYKKKQKKKSVSVQVISRSKPSALFKPAFVSLFRFDRSRFFVFSLSHIGSEILTDIVSSDSHPPSPLFFSAARKQGSERFSFLPCSHFIVLMSHLLMTRTIFFLHHMSVD